MAFVSETVREPRPCLGRRLRWSALLAALLWPTLAPAGAAAKLPEGYLVWVKSPVERAGERKVYRMTLPGKDEIVALTSGEDISPKISPDGTWVAYAKAKLEGGSDYHAFNLWKIYIVSIHGASGGRQELEIDANGYWPSWGRAKGGQNVLYYNTPDGKHSRIMRVRLDADGAVVERREVIATAPAFAGIDEINECVMAPDASWFAARTRGVDSVTGVGAYVLEPPSFSRLARAGSVGCMPAMAPSGEFAVIAGAEHGIRWGHRPGLPARRDDQLLVAAPTGQKAYHPGLASDGRWLLAAFGAPQNHNDGPYDLQIFPLDPQTIQAGPGQALASGGFNGFPDLWVGKPSAPPPPRARILSFLAASFTLLPGESTTLHWQTQDAEAVLLDGVSVAATGELSVTPSQNTRYELAASEAQGPTSATESLTIRVIPSAQPVQIERLELSALTIEQGHSATLSWSVRNAKTIMLDGRAVAPEGSRSLAPLATTRYQLRATGHLDNATKEVELAVTKVDDGLLSDRGGFVCGLATGSGTKQPAFPPTLALLLLAAAFATRAWRRR